MEHAPAPSSSFPPATASVASMYAWLQSLQGAEVERYYAARRERIRLFRSGPEHVLEFKRRAAEENLLDRLQALLLESPESHPHAGKAGFAMRAGKRRAGCVEVRTRTRITLSA